MSKGRARIVVRFNDEEMRLVQAAADVIQVDIKHLARMGILREVQDIRNKLIAELQKEKEAREEKSRAEAASAAVSGSESPSLSGSSLDSSAESGNSIGSQP